MPNNENEATAILKEILKWIKFSGIKEVRTVMTSTLDTEQKRLVYNLSDGKKGSVEISQIIKIGDSTVRRYWDSWARLGLMEPVKVQGGLRYLKSFELADFGLAVPQLNPDKQNLKEGETD
jgi:hypothetical protein